jgi:hypothetical protein
MMNENFSQKSLIKIWSIQKLFVTLHHFSLKPLRAGVQEDTEHIERFTIDNGSSTRVIKK